MATNIIPCNPVPSWTFVHGILIGQGSIFILIILFLKYVVFEDPETFKQKALLRDRITTTTRNKKATTTYTPPSPQLSTSSILSTLAYDLSSHAPESLDWLNILNAQMLTAYRTLISQSKTGNGGAKGLMEEILNKASGTEGGGGGPGGEGQDGVEGNGSDGPGLVGVDRIRVGEVELGDKFPVLSNARVRPSSEDGAVRIELDLDYTDHVSLSLSTSLLINFPRPRFAILPISLSLTLTRFSGTLTLELPSLTSTPISPTPSPTLHFSLHPDFTLQLGITSLLGSRAKLQDIPKVEQLILGRIRGFIQDRVVWPGRVEVGLPGLMEEVIRSALNGEEIEIELEGLEGEDWEWVEGSSEEGDLETESNGGRGLPNADSDDGGGESQEDNNLRHSPTLSRTRPRFAKTRKEEEEGEATLDLTADGGPSVYLRPKIRKRPITGAGARSTTTSSSINSNNLFQFPPNSPTPMMMSFNNNNNNNSFSNNNNNMNINGNNNENVSLHPWEIENDRPPSPTESLPGFYRDNNISNNGSSRKGKGLYANRGGAAGLGGIRYRNSGGMGLGL